MMSSRDLAQMQRYARKHGEYIICHDCGMPGGDELSPVCGICGRVCCAECFESNHLTNMDTLSDDAYDTEWRCGPCPELAEPTLNPHPWSAQADLDRLRQNQIYVCLHGGWCWGNGGGYLEGPGEPMPKDLLPREEQVR